MSYFPRIIDSELDEELPDLAAVAIEGAKGVGKTATASKRASTVLSLNDPRVRASVSANFDLITEMPKPVFIDEWQLEPQVWERVRIAVDAEPSLGGQYLLAGSSGLSRKTDVHTGAARIVSFVMRPMSLAERGISQPTVSLASILNGAAKISGTTNFSTTEYVDEILASGFPALRGLKPKSRDRQLDSYLNRIVERDLPENGMTVRRPAALRAWMRAYAAATSTQTEYSKLLNAATAGEADKPNRQTFDTYREHLQRLFILDPLEAWQPTFSPLNRLTFAPKHHLVDPALAARLVGIGHQGLLKGEGKLVSSQTGTWLGALFESLATQSVRIYATANGAHTGHLRTMGGEHEVDLIIEKSDLSIVACEVKLSDTISNKDVKHLVWLRNEIGERFIDGIVLYTGPTAYRRPDGIAVIPLALLGV